MSPADNAAKEPSMEEILASIRRIIEDNDGPKDLVVGADDLAARVEQLAVESKVDLSLEPKADKAIAPAPSRRLPHEISDSDSDAPIPPRNPVMEPDNMTTNGPAAKHSDGHQHAKMIDDEVKAFNAALGEDNDVTQETEQAVDNHKDIAVSPNVTGNSASLNAISGMLSEQTAGRVAASFGALTEAVDANRGSQMQNMTEQMLQPMLREWLDNNLPVIVERLVREEIERLARGEM